MGTQMRLEMGAKEQGRLTVEGEGVILVSCVSKKVKRRAKAEILYQSPWFRKARTLVKQTNAEWRILSAKHGVLHPEEVIAPYDLSIRDMNREDYLEWGKRVRQELYEDLIEREERPGEVVVMAGRDYRKPIIEWLRKVMGKVSVPMKGLGIGQQLQWLNRQTR